MHGSFESKFLVLRTSPLATGAFGKKYSTHLRSLNLNAIKISLHLTIAVVNAAILIIADLPRNNTINEPIHEKWQLHNHHP